MRAEHWVGVEDAVHELVAAGMHRTQVLVPFTGGPPLPQPYYLAVVEVVQLEITSGCGTPADHAPMHTAAEFLFSEPAVAAPEPRH